MVTDEMMAPFFDKSLKPVSDSPIILSPEFMPVAKDNRHGLFMTFWMQGNYLDYLLGEPISASLRALSLSERAQAIRKKLQRAVVQTQFDRDYPPTILVHGNIDPVIELAESQTTYDRLNISISSLDMARISRLPISMKRPSLAMHLQVSRNPSPAMKFKITSTPHPLVSLLMPSTKVVCLLEKIWFSEIPWASITNAFFSLLPTVTMMVARDILLTL